MQAAAAPYGVYALDVLRCKEHVHWEPMMPRGGISRLLKMHDASIHAGDCVYIASQHQASVFFSLAGSHAKTLG